MASVSASANLNLAKGLYFPLLGHWTILRPEDVKREAGRSRIENNIHAGNRKFCWQRDFKFQPGTYCTDHWTGLM